MANKRNRKKGEDIKQTNPKKELVFNSLMDHIQEPLIILSLLTAILSFAFPFAVPDAVPLIAFSLVLFLFALAALVMIYKYGVDGKDTKRLIVVPILIILTAMFLYWAQDHQANGNNDMVRDYSTFAMFFGMLTLACTIWIHKLVRLPAALAIVLFFSALIIHLTPAYTPQYAKWRGNFMSDLDSYYFYKQAKSTVKTGYLPEKETLAYPDMPVTIDEKGQLNSVVSFAELPQGWVSFLSSATTLLQPFDYTIKDVAILLPGVLGAVIVFLFYLLLKEAFIEMKPYNYPAAVFGAFMLMVNASYSSRAVATNPEDDTFGMFLLILTFYLFMMAMRRKSFFIGLLSGFSMLFLASSWAGYSYAVLVFGLFAAMYAVMNFLNGKSTVGFIPYFLIVMLMGLLSPVFLHAQGLMPQFTVLTVPFLLPFGGPIILAFLLETIRTYGKTAAKQNSGLTRLEERIELELTKYAPAITLVLLLMMAALFIFIFSPLRFVQYISALAGGAKQSEILGMTTAEQREMCPEGLTANCLLNTLRGHFGLGVDFGVLMVVFFACLFLLFLSSKVFDFPFDTPLVRSPGVVFVLAWSLPMLYGIVFKSQYQFNASAPLMALGATIGLLFPMKKEDFQGLRVLPLMGVVLITVAIPLIKDVPQYTKIFLVGPYGGSYPMYMEAGERVIWDGALTYIGTLPLNTVILTWWDYGHWITAESDRISILDNTKHERFMVQDIARFHVLAESEEEALEIARKYKATHVVIDYTMIGKSGAPHFIATSGLGGWIPLKGIAAKIECINGSGCENLYVSGSQQYASVPINGGSILIDLTTTYRINETRIEFPQDGPYKYKIEGSADNAKWTTLVDKTGEGYSGVQDDKFSDYIARYIKITGTYSSAGDSLKVKRIALYNPRYEGSYTGYAGCQFAPSASQVKPAPEVNKNNEITMVSKLLFRCTDYMGLLFNIRDQGYSVDDVYVAIFNNGQIIRLIPWKAWRDQTGASILGVHSFRSVIGNALGYPDRYANFPTYTTLVYVPGPKESPYDMNKVMMTKLYLGDYLEEYQSLGLADAGIKKAKYFSLIEDFRGDKPDNSYWGYVRIYKINYPENATTEPNYSLSPATQEKV